MNQFQVPLQNTDSHIQVCAVSAQSHPKTSGYPKTADVDLWSKDVPRRQLYGVLGWDCVICTEKDKERETAIVMHP